MSFPVIGQLYIPNYHGIAWSQPGGTGTTVYPQQNDGPFTAYPVPGQFFAEAGESLWRSGCGHGWDAFHISRDYDPNTSSSAAVIYCPLCSYVVQILEPYDLVYSVTQYPIIVG